MIGKRIRELRTEKGVTQRELASFLSLTPKMVSFYENNERVPPADILIKLSKYFNVSIDYLLGRTAFKNNYELFEHWDGRNDPYFEAPFDFGELLKKERKSIGVSQEEASKALQITVSDVNDIEEGTLPLNYDWAEKYAQFLGTSVKQIFDDNGMSSSLDDIPLDLLQHYHEQGLSGNEIRIAYENFKKAVEEDSGFKEPVKPQNKHAIDTVAAHLTGKDITPKKLKLIEQYIDALFEDEEENQ